MQEVPYKAKTAGKWGDTNCYQNFLNEFRDYTLYMNNSFCVRYALSITNPSSFTPCDEYTPKNNRTVSAKSGYPGIDLTILGVHMPTGFEGDSDGSKIWDDFMDFTKKERIPFDSAGRF